MQISKMSNLSRLDHHNWRKCSSKVYDWSKCTTTRRRQRRGCFIAWYYLAMDCYTVSKIRQILGSLWLSITSSIFWLDNKNQTMYHLGEWTGQRRKRRTDTDGLPNPEVCCLSLDCRYFGGDPLLRFILSFLTRQQKTQTPFAIREGRTKGRAGSLLKKWARLCVALQQKKNRVSEKSLGETDNNRHEWIATSV